MITFLICVAFLVVGYLVYGKYVAKVFEPDDRTTPAVEINDGVDFTKGPAGLLAMLTPEVLNDTFWMWAVMIYYFVATFVPIDKVIGKLYPIFGACLIIMAVGVSGSMLFSGNYVMPELWENFGNMHPNSLPIWSFMFISIACGAMVAEGIIAVVAGIAAAAGLFVFFNKKIKAYQK